MCPRWSPARLVKGWALWPLQVGAEPKWFREMGRDGAQARARRPLKQLACRHLAVHREGLLGSRRGIKFSWWIHGMSHSSWLLSKSLLGCRGTSKASILCFCWEIRDARHTTISVSIFPCWMQPPTRWQTITSWSLVLPSYHRKMTSTYKLGRRIFLCLGDRTAQCPITNCRLGTASRVSVKHPDAGHRAALVSTLFILGRGWIFGLFSFVGLAMQCSLQDLSLLARDWTHTLHSESTENQPLGASHVVLVVKNPPAKAGDITDVGSVPELGRSPGRGHGNPLQYSCLENLMDRGAWLAGYSPWGHKRVRHDWCDTH